MNFIDTRRKNCAPLAMGTNIHQKETELRKRSEKKTIPCGMLWQDGREKDSAIYLIRRGETPSPRLTSIDETNDCVMKSERGALVKGPDAS